MCIYVCVCNDTISSTNRVMCCFSNIPLSPNSYFSLKWKMWMWKRFLLNFIVFPHTLPTNLQLVLWLPLSHICFYCNKSVSVMFCLIVSHCYSLTATYVVNFRCQCCSLEFKPWRSIGRLWYGFGKCFRRDLRGALWDAEETTVGFLSTWDSEMVSRYQCSQKTNAFLSLLPQLSSSSCSPPLVASLKVRN